MKKLLTTSVLATSLLVGVAAPAFAKTTTPTVSVTKIKEAKAQAVKSMDGMRATVKSYKSELDTINVFLVRTEEMRSIFRQIGLNYIVNESNYEYNGFSESLYNLKTYLSNEQLAFDQNEINAFASRGNVQAIKNVEATFKKNVSVTAKMIHTKDFAYFTNLFENTARLCTLGQINDWFQGDLSTIEKYYEENGQYKASIESQGYDIITHYRKPMMDYQKYTSMVTEVNGVMSRANATNLDQINNDLTDWVVAKPTGLKYLRDLLPAHLSSEIDSLKKENDKLKSLLLNMQDLRSKYLGQ
ncbi:MAG: hypothetical protein Q8906_03630 [Bacillota bacterium]|nr:hypothetical protein [Bacillota bacterium]MDP4169677.1 hypothetical protein [Bacillota bacterium]